MIDSAVESDSSYLSRESAEIEEDEGDIGQYSFVLMLGLSVLFLVSMLAILYMCKLKRSVKPIADEPSGQPSPRVQS